MRLLLSAVLLQACVSSSIQLGEDSDAGPDTGNVDAGTVDAGSADSGTDVHVPPGPDGGMADADCPSAAPQPGACFNATCDQVPVAIDPLTCETVCNRLPEGCFEACRTSNDCDLYNCCEADGCELVARHFDGEEYYLEACPEEIPSSLVARCIENKCEVAEYSQCAPGEGVGACVALMDDGECGGNIAVNADVLEDYIDLFCDPDGDPLPICCDRIRMTSLAGCNPRTLECEAVEF